MKKLRSQEWLTGDDEVSVAHRVALRSVGLNIKPGEARPIIGIADSSSELNPCNLPLHALADAAHAGVLAAGGLPVRFPTMSLGEDLMKPSAFLYRNLLAMEIEETLRSNPLDGVVLLANCDKTVPAVLMGAASANLPAIAVLGGDFRMGSCLRRHNFRLFLRRESPRVLRRRPVMTSLTCSGRSAGGPIGRRADSTGRND